MHRVPFFPHLCTFFFFFKNSYSIRCDMIFHCAFGLQFPDDYWCWASFYGHLHPSLERCLFWSSASVFPWLLYLILWLSDINSLCILDINPYWKYNFANIFFHSVGCLFTLLIVSFTVQKFFCFLQFDIVSFIYSYSFPCAFGVISKKSVPRPLSKEFLFKFSSSSFMGLGLIFKSLIHFVLIFLYGIS